MYVFALIIASTEVNGVSTMQIRKLRKRRFMTLEQLAAKSGVGRVNINRYELGTVEPGVHNAIKIARALGCTVEQLVADEEGETADGETENAQAGC